jgi:hypothetical protein
MSTLFEWRGTCGFDAASTKTLTPGGSFSAMAVASRAIAESATAAIQGLVNDSLVSLS